MKGKKRKREKNPTSTYPCKFARLRMSELSVLCILFTEKPLSFKGAIFIPIKSQKQTHKELHTHIYIHTQRPHVHRKVLAHQRPGHIQAGRKDKKSISDFQ